MTPQRKKRLTYITIGIFFLLQGVEYAVILPTLWLYIEETFHGRAYMLGLVLSAFSFAGLLASPLMGRWSDVTHNTKIVLLVANVFQIIGSIMYFIGLSVWFLVGARLVAGFGSGVTSALFADIARVTSTEERTSVMSVFMAVRQIGLLLGPGCNLFLRQLHFHIGPFLVDKYTSPGVFMAILWILHEFLSFAMYWNLPTLQIEETLKKAQNEEPTTTSSGSRYLIASRIPDMESPLLRPSSSFSINSQSRHSSSRGALSPRLNSTQHESENEDQTDLIVSNDFIEEAEKYMGETLSQDDERDDYQQVSVNVSISDPDPASISRVNTHSSLGAPSETRDFEHLYDNSYNSGFDSDGGYRDSDVDDGDITITSVGQSQQGNKKLSLSFIYHEFVREEVVTVLFTSFVTFFNQVGIETLFTPLSKKLLKWGELENSYLYCGAGAEVIMVFFLVRYLSKRFGDRWLLLFGFLLLTATIAVSTWFIPQAKPDHYASNMAGLLLLVFFDVFSLPFLAVTSASLYSKITKEETQGLAQGVRRTSVGLGTILGPLWAGCMLEHLLVNFLLALGICLLALVMLLFSFRRLNEDIYYKRKTPKKKYHKQQPTLNGVVTRSWDETQNEQQPLLH